MSLFVSLLIFVAFLCPATPAQAVAPSTLGVFSFPTSGTVEAQTHFHRGVGALHSFWYEEAVSAFREATQVQPDFLMGYWGEAMTYNHPIWQEEDLKAARKVLNSIPKNIKATPRERAYINALRVLYGEGSKSKRDLAYASAMEQLYQDYPEDLEAAAFYTLALLGVAQHHSRGSKMYVKAGALALDIMQKNPKHPGAAHYAIHAFDDPLHAILALPAAQQYAQIAPESHHAQHMPAHIFLQLGMWSESALSNQAGWDDSVAWTRKAGLPLNFRDYHSLYWLHYTYLQQGRFRAAKELLDLKRQDMKNAGATSKTNQSGSTRNVNRYYNEMIASYIINSEQWEIAGALMDPSGETAQTPNPLSNFTLGFAVAMTQNSEGARALLEILPPIGEPIPSKTSTHHSRTIQDIRKFELAAAIQFSQGQHDNAITLLKKAVELENSLPYPSGPPDTIKPPHELLGEILLESGHFQGAKEMFDQGLARFANRARSLLGRARALAKMEQQALAKQAYRRFLNIWAMADQDLPELKEARTYLQQP